MLPPVFQNSYSKAPFYARNFPFWLSNYLDQTSIYLWTLTRFPNVCRKKRRPTFRFLGSGSGKKKVLSKSMDTHTSWWQAAANALAMPFVSFFCCVPQAQLRGKGHEKRNWKWIFWRSYFYLTGEKQKTRKSKLVSLIFWMQRDNTNNTFTFLCFGMNVIFMHMEMLVFFRSLFHYKVNIDWSIDSKYCSHKSEAKVEL